MKHQNIVFIFTLLLVLTALSPAKVSAADGDPDASFGSSGFMTEGSPYFDFETVAVQPDGKILTGGRVLVTTPNFSFKAGLVRYNPDGSLDTSFGAGGKLTAQSPDGTFDFLTLLLQPDGKFVMVGRNAPISGNNTRIIIARYNSNGSPDTAFGTNGYTLSNFPDGNSHFASDAVLQPDGKIVVSGGWRGTAFCVARWNADGSLDTNFGTTGGDTCAATTQAGTGGTQSIALQTDGKIVVGGRFATSFTEPFDFMVFRFNPNGTLDTSFDGDGYARTDLNGGNDNALSVLIRPTGKIVAIGSARVVNGPDTGFGLVQYNPDGSLDANFGTGGKSLVTFAGGELFVEDFPAGLMADGRIVIGRTRRRESPNIGNESQIARFNPNGSLDTTFGAGGQIVSQTIAQIRDLTLQTDGKIVAVGLTPGSVAIVGRFLNTDAAPPAFNPAQRVADFDGDQRSDAAVFRDGTWFIEPSAGPNLAPQAAYQIRFGLSTDRLTPADFDGDGKTDIAVWREGTAGAFYILQSTNGTVRAVNFGLSGDDPRLVGDWDGDGKADPAVYRGGAQGYFFYLGSSNNPGGQITYLNWGTSGDRALRGDYDGDGKMDAAVFRPADSTWQIRQSSNGQPRYEVWGLSTDKFVPADYDGDGRTDPAVFRSGVWYVKQSSNNQAVYRSWGLQTDALVPGDYDGDGRTDIAVWRDGVYYIFASASSQIQYRYFGTGGDKPVAAAFLD